jgi:hypothetical protein
VYFAGRRGTEAQADVSPTLKANRQKPHSGNNLFEFPRPTGETNSLGTPYIPQPMNPEQQAAVANLFGVEQKPPLPAAQPPKAKPQPVTLANAQEVKKLVVLPPIKHDEEQLEKLAHTRRLIHEWMADNMFGDAAEQARGLAATAGTPKAIQHAFALSIYAGKFMAAVSAMPTYTIYLAQLLGFTPADIEAYNARVQASADAAGEFAIAEINALSDDKTPF